MAELFGAEGAYVANASTPARGNSEAAWRLAFESDVNGAVKAAEAVDPYLEAAAAAKRFNSMSPGMILDEEGSLAQL